MKDWKRLRVPRLPKEYQEVEYLETHVQGYIDSGLWCGLVDYVTVYGRDNIKVKFKDGTEI